MIAQTLHGYDQGHRLLARGGDVSDEELALLDRLSDLSGYVPLGTELDVYHTGFPCGRYYAFACTWPDTKAMRAGTVLTHTLLIPLTALDGVHDLWGLDGGHRRPATAEEREPYTVPAPVDLGGGALPPPIPSAERALSATLLWFGQPERPVLWMEDTRPDDVVRYLWWLLWPAARQRFAFCTFTLQVRHLRRQPFGFLALPKSARGSFHERARSAAWWREGEQANEGQGDREGQPWVRAVLENGAAATWAVPRFCEEHGLPLLDEVQFPAFHRFTGLEDSARVRLTAARARVDLLLRLWPEIPPGHALARATLQQLLRRQSEAPLSPRPFWDLDDFLTRPVVIKLAKVDEVFGLEIADVIAREVRRRLSEAVALTVVGLVALLQHGLLPGFRDAVLGAVRAVFEVRGEDEAQDVMAAEILLGSVEAREPALVEAVLGPLPPARRLRVMLSARSLAPAEALAVLDDHLLTAAGAGRLADPALTGEVWLAQGQPLRAALEAGRIVATMPGGRPEVMDPILARLDDATRLSWAFEVSEPSLSSWAAARGAEAAISLKVAFSDLLARAETAPNGAEVVISYLVTGTVVDDLPDGDLLGAPVLRVMVAASTSPVARRVAERVASRLVRRIAGEAPPLEESATWLGMTFVQDALARLSPVVLFGADETWEETPGCLPNLARAAADQVRAGASPSLSWVANVLERPLARAGRKSLERAHDDLDGLLRWGPPDRDGWLLLAGRILAAVRSTDSKTASALVELAFPALYARLVRNDLTGPAREAMSKEIYDWNIAKSWRRWLLDAWLDHRWPPASFLHCMHGDETLFYRIARRARWGWRGRDLLWALKGVLEKDPQLAVQWSGPVTRALGYDDLPVDDD